MNSPTHYVTNTSGSLSVSDTKTSSMVIASEDLLSLLPGVYYMDPPDGGSVTVFEQLQRMAKDAERYRWLRDKAVYFTYPEGHPDGTSSPYCCYMIGMGDTEPTWGNELDSMLQEAMTEDSK